MDWHQRSVVRQARDAVKKWHIEIILVAPFAMLTAVTILADLPPQPTTEGHPAPVSLVAKTPASETEQLPPPQPAPAPAGAGTRSDIEASEPSATAAPAAPSGPPDLVELRALYTQDAAFWPTATIDPEVDYVELGVPKLPKRQDVSDPLAQLGKTLFEDPRLSKSGHFSCQSCHHRQLGWGDGLPRSFGHGRQEGRRNAPSLFAAAAQTSLFWDGRASTLEEQALGPLLAPDEMANDDLESVVARVAASANYPSQMKEVFGSPEVNISRIASAIAAFQRTLDRPTRFDRFLRGAKDILSDEAIWGLHLFRTKARCANCHMGPNLTDGKFHNLGLSYYNRKLEDLGRYSVTGDPADVGKFKTPSLRHLARTGPYMHNGVFPSLRGLVNLYAIGGGRSARELDKDDPLFPHAAAKSPQIKRLDLTNAEREAIVAFLNEI